MRRVRGQGCGATLAAAARRMRATNNVKHIPVLRRWRRLQFHGSCSRHSRPALSQRLLTELLHKVGIDVVAYFITQSRLWRKGGFAFSRLSLLVDGVIPSLATGRSRCTAGAAPDAPPRIRQLSASHACRAIVKKTWEFEVESGISGLLNLRRTNHRSVMKVTQMGSERLLAIVLGAETAPPIVLRSAQSFRQPLACLWRNQPIAHPHMSRSGRTRTPGVV